MSAKDPSSTPMPEPDRGPAPTVDGDVAPVVERKFVGLVEVDSGTMVVGDPAYLLGFKAEDRAGVDYQEIIDAPIQPIQELRGRPVLLFHAPEGDGSYPVFAEFEDGELLSFTVYLTTLDDEG